MDRRQCAACSKTISSFAVTWGVHTEESSYHRSCWNLAQLWRQRDYERQIRTEGLSALIAPYVYAAPVPAPAPAPIAALVGGAA